MQQDKTAVTDEAELGEDMLYGLQSIAAFINRTERQTHHLIEKKLIPAGKLGGTLVGSRATIRAHLRSVCGASNAAA